MLNGFVLLANALSTDFVDKIYEDWIDLANHLLENDPEKTDVGISEFRKKRIRMDTPFRDPYTDPRLVANSFAMPIIERFLGEDCRVCYYSADAPLPGSDYQVVHADYKPFFPESDVVLPIAGLVVNFPLIDVTEGNGPMDVWPNSHLLPERAYSAARIPDAARSIEPTKMLTPKGSMLIRDVRMWHRGTPNVSNQIRPNLALIYTRSWWDGAFYPQDSLGITRDKLRRPARTGEATLSLGASGRLVAFDLRLSGAEPTEIPGCLECKALLSRLSIFDLDKSSAKTVHATTTHIEAPNWTPDGTALIVNGSGRLYRVPLSAPGLEAIDAGFAVNINNDHGVSPDGKSLVISDSTENGDSCICALPISGGSREKFRSLHHPIGMGGRPMVAH